MAQGYWYTIYYPEISITGVKLNITYDDLRSLLWENHPDATAIIIR